MATRKPHTQQRNVKKGVKQGNEKPVYRFSALVCTYCTDG